MNEPETSLTRRRRSHEEAAQLVSEYEASGLSRREFSRARGIALHTLNRYCARWRQPDGRGTRWLAVELPDSGQGHRPSGLVLLVGENRRVEIGTGFDAATLEQLLRVVERA